jgi:hypothetical protein
MSRLLPLLVLAAACTPVDPGQLPPPGEGGLQLIANGALPGQLSAFVVTGAQPGQALYVGGSTYPLGDGACPPLADGLCLELESPFLLGAGVADAAGVATIRGVVPVQPASVSSIHLQALGGGGTHDAATSNTLTLVLQTADLDGDGFYAGDDCDDDDPEVYPGAPERCDGVDNDCDARTSEIGVVRRDGVVQASLTTALRTASAGADIAVCGGVHTGVMRATVPLSLRGVGPTPTTLRPTDELRVAADAVVEDLTIERARSGIVLDCPGSGCRLEARRLVVQDNDIDGIYASWWTTLLVEDSVIRRNGIGSAVAAGVFVHGYAEVVRTDVVDNDVQSYGGGLFVSLWGAADVRDSRVLRNHAGTLGGGAFVDGLLRSLRTDWGFGSSDNTPRDVSLADPIQGGYRSYDATGTDFECVATGPNCGR